MWYELIQDCIIYCGKLAGSGAALKLLGEGSVLIVYFKGRGHLLLPA